MITLGNLRRIQCLIHLTAIIDSALCVGAGGSSGSLTDKPIVRTADSRLLIPASQLKGRLRHECEKLVRGLGWDICQSPKAETMCPQRAGISGNFARTQYATGDRDSSDQPRYHCLICQIFGNPTLPARVIFNDLICQQPPETLPEVFRPGVAINRRRRTAEDQKLYFLETSPANAKLEFSGTLDFQPGCPDFAMPLILSGLHHIHALGGRKSAGLGWLTWDWEKLPKLNRDDPAWEQLRPLQNIQGEEQV